MVNASLNTMMMNMFQGHALIFALHFFTMQEPAKIRTCQLLSNAFKNKKLKRILYECSTSVSLHAELCLLLSF